MRQELQNADFGTVLYENLTSKLADANMLKNLLEQSLSVGLGTALFDTADGLGQTFWDRVLSPAGVADADWEAIAAAINAKLEELGLNPITIDVNTGKVSANSNKTSKEDTQELVSTSRQLVSGLSEVTSGLKSMGAEIPEGVEKFVGVMQGAVSILEGIQTLMSLTRTATIPAEIASINANTVATNANTIAHAANTASNTADFATDVIKVGAMIATMHNGGVVRAKRGLSVPGTHYSGDVTPVLANAGELILNRAQQGNLVSQFEGGNHNNQPASKPYVTGQEIYLGLTNYLIGAGLGSLVTTKSRI